MSDSGQIAGDRDLLAPDYYARHGYPFSRWKQLRREDPVHWVEAWGGEPYWAVTRQREIIAISRQPDAFINSKGFNLFPFEDQVDTGQRQIIDMDPPQHQDYRSLVSKRFTPRALIPLAKQVDQITDQLLDRIATDGKTAEIDFVRSVAALLPIWVIAEMLGVPGDDWERIFHWTNEAVGASDPEYQRGRSTQETRMSALTEMTAYFEALAEDRRQRPRDDLVTVLVKSRIDGELMPRNELLSYFSILIAAGNETTRNATSSGMLALIENPDQLALARSNPALLDSLVEEVLRFTSPVIHMARTATRAVEIAGRKIQEGQKVAMFYPSANRDEEVFRDPDAFRIDRRPNRHLAFGVGEHFCLGAHVARLELRVIFRHLLERLEFIELAGPVERVRMAAVGGIKRLPIRYRLRAAR
ncbi:MAG TPA: cytochrome P450 [Myxococcota bacterium]|nr:cytochrome P450 [Myxococcota bacterium]